jgi:hypothetical protein
MLKGYCAITRPLKNFLTFYGLWNFITVLARHPDAMHTPIRMWSCEKFFKFIHKTANAPISFVSSRQIFMRYGNWVFFENLLRKFKFYDRLTRIMGILHEDQYTFLMISRLYLHGIKKISDKGCRVKQNAHFMCNNCFLKSCYCWYNVEEYCRSGQDTGENMMQALYMLDIYLFIIYISWILWDKPFRYRKSQI